MSGFRQGENPAHWRGHLDKLLASKAKVRTVGHHAALPCAELPAFMAELADQQGIAVRALEFAIRTAARTGVVIGATWEKIDLLAKVWTIPKERMKAGREHRVPLNPRGVAILKEMEAVKTSEFVFPGGRAKRPLSNMALLNALKRMGLTTLTTLGFRSTFRDWAAETTDYAEGVVEMALAHTIGNKVEAAYRRGDFFEKRKGLMGDWGRSSASLE